MKAFLQRRWFSIDHRTLGLFRIAFGLCLIGNLYDHAAGGNLVAFFTNDGVLSNHLALFAPIQARPWSLLFAFSRPGEVVVAFAAIFVVYVLYTVGWRTRLMQVLVIVCFISLVNRNLLLQDGGSFTCTILAVWTAFLPLGARFSVDRLRAAKPVHDGGACHVSFVCFALLLQLAVIYGFNAANKTGSTWRDGTAVHYILWQLSRNTALADLLRWHEPSWFSPLLTHGTIIFEWIAPVLVVSPLFQRLCRRTLIAGIWILHLGIASLMSLGPFSYAMLVYSTLLLQPADWEAWQRSRLCRALLCGGRRAMGRTLAHLPVSLLAALYRLRFRAVAPAPTADEAPARVMLIGPTTGAWSAGGMRRPTKWRVTVTALREGVAAVLFVSMFAELTLANAVVPEPLRWSGRPSWMAEVLYYLRVYQTWAMFSADVPTTDGGIVVDATLADGTKVDPLTGQPPDLEAPLHGASYGLDHDWSEYMFYYSWERHRQFRAGLRDHILLRHGAGVVAPQKQIRALDIYWVTADCPPPGEVRPRNLKRELMISYAAAP